MIATYSLSLMFGIGYVWSVKMSRPMNLYSEEDSYPITDHSTLQKFLLDQDSLSLFSQRTQIITHSNRCIFKTYRV